MSTNRKKEDYEFLGFYGDYALFYNIKDDMLVRFKYDTILDDITK